MEKIFTLELDKEKEFIEIHLNQVGAIYLRDILNKIIETNQNADYHLMTPDWGGDELTSKKQEQTDKTKLIQHLKLFYWD